MKHWIGAAMMAAVAFTATAEAAPEQFIGKWSCKVANRPAPGGDTSQFWIFTFDMNLIAQGSFTASGTYENTLGQTPFTVEDGKWQEEAGGLGASGPARMSAMDGMVLVVVAKPQPDGSLTGEYTSNYGTTLTYCNR